MKYFKVILFVLFGLSLYAQPRVDNSTENAQNTATSISFSHNVATSNTELVVVTVFTTADKGAYRAGADPTFGGNAMTQVLTDHNNGNEVEVEMFYYINDSGISTGNHTVALGNTNGHEVSTSVTSYYLDSGSDNIQYQTGQKCTDTDALPNCSYSQTTTYKRLGVAALGNGYRSAVTNRSWTAIHERDTGNENYAIMYSRASATVALGSVNWTSGGADDSNITIAIFDEVAGGGVTYNLDTWMGISWETNMSAMPGISDVNNMSHIGTIQIEN